MPNIIRLDSDIVANNASNLHETAAELPPVDTIAQVHGNRTEVAAQSFTERLETQSGKLGAAVEKLRSFVAQNADALTHAVQALRDTDRMTSQAAGEAEALINDIATAPASGTAGGASSSENATRTAFQRR